MERILKNNSLETAKNRLDITGLTYLVVSGDTTKYVEDRIVNNTTDEYLKYIPIVTDAHNNNKVLRYKDVMFNYYWLNNKFIHSCTYIKACIRDSELTWINLTQFDKENPYTTTAVTIYEDNIGESFPIESASTGDVFCVTPLYDELIYRYETFENSKNVYNFVTDLIDNGEYSNYGNGPSTPYLNFSVYIEQETVDEGLMDPCVEYWIPGKRYYLGDIVYYSEDGSAENVKTYKLVSGNTSYCGYYDSKTRLIYFDDPNNSHWAEYIDYLSGVTNYSVSGVTESLLNNIKRRKSDVDESGNTLPFILHYNIVNEDRELDTATTETYFICGYTNVKYEDGNITCDCLSSITFYNPDTSVTTNSYVYNDSTEPLMGNDIRIDDNYNTADFSYIIGAKIVKVGNNYEVDVNTGVKYIETKPFTKKNGEFSVEISDDVFSSVTLPYLVFEDSTEQQIAYANDDYLESMKDTTFSNFLVDSGQTTGDYFLKGNIFKDEAKMGIQNTIEEIDVTIERSIAESYQKFYMFSEITSLQDLENYKNGKYLEKK